MSDPFYVTSSYTFHYGTWSGCYGYEWHYGVLPIREQQPCERQPLQPAWHSPHSHSEWGHVPMRMNACSDSDSQSTSSSYHEYPLSPSLDSAGRKTTDPLSLTPLSGKRKQRLFQFLYEMLQNPEMRSCIWWVQSTSGTFQFSSQNKEQLAQMWGRRKGNRKTMTYQKMARALRNYSRTGEICKVKRKLTYQFNEVTLKGLREDMQP
ncbi:transcription factor Spi-B-like isoform X2 [Denticeps clupeoides]|uniref:transcription factor Spi-B-like isoform X2 n=1 Tax=Denticeps clupeoides TaxID=299321 RepID=UPI0010A3379B|nr:transcription factor Spi-B-like isoform X2 [Denticeps clupeoides]